MRRKRRRKLWVGPAGQPILCYLCGERPAITADHIPPQCLFPSTADFRGFELPACRECNNGFAKDDEYFRDVLTMVSSNEDAMQVFKEGTLPSITRLYAQLSRITKAERIFKTIIPVPIRTPAGLYLETRHAIQIDTDRFKGMYERIVKGLYYTFLKKPLAKDCRIVSIHSSEITGDIYRDLMAQQGDPILARSAGDTFLFGLWAVPNDDYMSGIWILRFYDKHAVAVVVDGPAGKAAASEPPPSLS